MILTEEQTNHALSFVIEPDLKKDIVALNLIRNLKFEENAISFDVLIHNPALHNKKRMQDACEHQIHRFYPEVKVNVNILPLGDVHARDPQLRTILPGVKKIIAISSGKGGVGKSTMTANIAVGLAQKGYKVGLVDADIYGPSMPLMFDVLHEKPKVDTINEHQYMMPVENYGVKLLSIGFFADLNQAMIWRGPMASKALVQMFKDVYWGELDYMLIDLPPGTGDIHLTIAQQIPIDGAIIITTPQPVALADARKGIAMFQSPNINKKVLGLIENMAWFTPAELPNNKYYIFGQEGGKHLAEELNIPLLGQIPLIQGVREAADVGRPFMMQNNALYGPYFEGLVQKVEEFCRETVKIS